MKRILFYFVFLNSIFAFSQTEKDILIKDIQNSIKAYNESEFDTLLKYFPDFVFDNISKEELLKQMANNKHKQKNVEVSEVEVDTIVTIDSVKYARFHLKSQVSYGIKRKANWTFIDLSAATEKYIPIEVRESHQRN